ncbi:hypothetical protein [Rhodohalobacter sp.]|uniref:hypothetical protein n=1 Tax=Rhodohalobacter sp. TaxID=1974210 RepID=UPI002ACE2036|nr:hypothetical protein [Rhodohalobacter sp.]MDZ7755224.1 hypothetical protein [Rhodohalobacter sp.]
MSTEIRNSIWLIIIIFALVSCDVMEVTEDDSNIGEDKNQVITEPIIDSVDLRDYGLNEAIDINDRGDIIGGTHYWNSDNGSLIDIGISVKALNNHGQVIGRDYYWDMNQGVDQN